MARRLSKRQRLKRDPANQRLHKLVAWVRRNQHVLEPVVVLPGLVHRPRLKWRDRHLPRAFRHG